MDIEDTYEYKLAYRLWLDGYTTTNIIRYQGFYNIMSDMWDKVEELLKKYSVLWNEKLEERYK